ncbi:MAG: alanine racemase [Demequinaceae bacterium]|nr:alanine racemase [Demequinaceae bacterium]
MTGLEVCVDYDAIAHNVGVLAERAAGAQVMAVVKGDGYGHGLIETARAARRGGASWLGVAQPGEALTLRAADDAGPLLTWLYGPEVPAAALIRHGIDVSVGSLPVLEAIMRGADEAGQPARLHVCVDTGLGREGATLEDLPGVLDAVAHGRAEGRVEPVGLWSHLAWADAPGHPIIDEQARAFERAIAMADEMGVSFEVRHLANSAAVLTRPDLRYDLVRPGIAVYGLPPVPDPEGRDFGLIPAMRVTTTLALVKRVGRGQGVSYGHEYVTDRETVLGLVSVGYADGVFRSAGNRAGVSIGGKRYRIVGRVCMDQFVVDLGPEPGAREGDEVVLIGPGGPTAREWAEAAGTIDYEVVCRFGGLRAKSGDV